jgi:RimJ/RimL family protein N-acetyltransferase
VASDLNGWLRARDWQRVQDHFARIAPRSAEDFEARGLATAALRGGADGARRALPDLQRARDLQPQSPLLALNLLQALIHAGEAAEACRLSAALVPQFPGHRALREQQVHALVAAAHWDQALQAAATVDAAAAGAAASAHWAALRAELQTGWWRPLVMGGLTLRLAHIGDRDFVGRCWRDDAFMRRFHRFQPGDDAALTSFIARVALLPSRSRRLDWVVCRADEAIGLAALVDLDLAQRRGELLLGFPQARAPAGAALKAALAAMQFGFHRLDLNKLVSHVYGDNPESQANTLHLGLRQEGLLREHLQGPAGPVDLYVNGLLAREFRADARLQRLLRRWCPPPR